MFQFDLPGVVLKKRLENFDTTLLKKPCIASHLWDTYFDGKS